MENIKAIIEALILSSEAPLGVEKICAVLPEVEKSEIRKTFDNLAAEYNERAGGIYLEEVAGGFQFRTRPEFGPWIKKMRGTKPPSLSRATMETLAIIAYRQPVVKSEIESIRGVDVSYPLKGLLEKKLVRIVGRKDVPGKPIIYGTTKRFLEVFNLKDLSELPTLRELKELNEPAENLLPVEAQDEEEADATLQTETDADCNADAKDDISVNAETKEETETDNNVKVTTQETRGLNEEGNADKESTREMQADGNSNTPAKTETETDVSDEKPTEEVNG